MDESKNTNPFGLSADTLARLRLYAQLLARANERARLTGPTDSQTLYDEHIADALAALPFLPEASGAFVDVGTGGGLPGLVWGICRPDLQGVLLDSIGKKSALVAEMARELGCDNIEVVNARSEDYAATHREQFDVATARAVATAIVLAEYLSPLVRVGGKLIAFKGPGAAGEIAIPAHKWKTLGLAQPKLHQYETAGKSSVLVIWEKVRPCPPRYPRKPGMAEKSPWI